MKAVVRRWSCILLVLCVVLTFFADVPAGAVTSGSWSYTLLNDGTVEINDYTGEETKLVVPEQIDGKLVTGIGKGAFYNCTSLKSIELPTGLKNIGASAFECCTSLVDVKLPEGLKSMGTYAFYKCTSLIEIKIPIGLESISACTFEGCSSLKSAELPEGLTSIESYVFSGCIALKNVKLPDTLTHIGTSAFHGCSLLTGIELPESLESIDSYGFCNCSSIESIDLSSKLDNISASVFLGCSMLKSVKLPEGLTSIGPSAFSHCISLVSIELPEKVTTIGANAFYSCKVLECIKLPSALSSIGSNAFSGCSDNMIFYGDSGSIAESYAEENRIAFKKGSPTDYVDYNYIENNDGTLTITKCKLNQTELEVPETIYGRTVAAIGAAAFAECTNTEKVLLPESVRVIDKEVFYGCTKLTTVQIPEGVTTIGDEAFYGCTSLEELNLPASLSKIGTGTFGGCPSISINDGNTNYKSINHGIFTADGEILLACDSSATEVYKVPAGVRKVEDKAFSYCFQLEKVILSDSVATLGERVFEECSSLKMVRMPATVTSIGESAFSGVPDGFCLEVEEGSAGESYAKTNKIPYKIYDKALEEAKNNAYTLIEQRLAAVRAQLDALKDLTDAQRAEWISAAETKEALAKESVDQAGSVDEASVVCEDMNDSLDTILREAEKQQADNRDAERTAALEQLEKWAQERKESYGNMPGLSEEEKALKKAEIDRQVEQLKQEISKAGTLTEIKDVMPSVSTEKAEAKRFMEEKLPSCNSEIAKLSALSDEEKRNYLTQLENILALKEKEIEDAQTVEAIWAFCKEGIFSFDRIVSEAKNTAQNRVSLDACVISVGGTYTYDGEEKKPAVTVNYGNRNLTENEDFLVSYEDNVDAGTARVVIESIPGKSYGKCEKTFIIRPSDIPAKKIEEYWKKKKRAKISKRVINNVVYTGKTITKSAILKAMEGKEFPSRYLDSLTEGTDYTISFKKIKKLGKKATVTLRFKGNYTGNTKFVIWIHRPATPTKLKARKSGNNVILTWKKSQGGATGYYIHRTTKNKISGGSLGKEIAYVRAGKPLKYIDKTAKKGKKYYYYVIACYSKGKETAGVSQRIWKKNVITFKLK